MIVFVPSSIATAKIASVIGYEYHNMNFLSCSEHYGCLNEPRGHLNRHL